MIIKLMKVMVKKLEVSHKKENDKEEKLPEINIQKEILF